MRMGCLTTASLTQWLNRGATNGFIRLCILPLSVELDKLGKVLPPVVWTTGAVLCYKLGVIQLEYGLYPFVVRHVLSVYLHSTP
jgi:hypothetical protein